MKREITASKSIWLLALLLLPFATKAQKQQTLEAEDKQEALAINPAHDRSLKLHPLQVGEVYVSYEKLRTARVSNELGLSYVYRSFLKGDEFIPEDKKVTGVGIRMSQRHYTSKKKEAPFGFFHGPMFGYRFMVFEKNVFNQPELSQNDPNYQYIGRFYQNTLELGYQLGGQFLLSQHLTMELSGAIGGRMKYAYAMGAGDFLEQRVIGYQVTRDRNSLIKVAPVPQLNLAVGYAF